MDDMDDIITSGNQTTNPSSTQRSSSFNQGFDSFLSTTKAKRILQSMY